MKWLNYNECEEAKCPNIEELIAIVGKQELRFGPSYIVGMHQHKKIKLIMERDSCGELEAYGKSFMEGW